MIMQVDKSQKYNVHKNFVVPLYVLIKNSFTPSV